MPLENSSQKKYSEILEKLSPELLKVLVSEETPRQISEICLRNEVEEEEKIKAIAYQVGQVLLGQLSPEKFQDVLEKEVKLRLTTAKTIAEEISQNIFLPLKSSLEKIYKIEILPSAKPEITPPPEAEPGPPRKDIYREPIE